MVYEYYIMLYHLG